MKQQIEVLQAFRGLAAVWVVLFHVGFISQDRGLPVFAGDLFRQGHIGVDFFFVLSGFIILHVHQRDLGKPESTGVYVAKRFFRVFPLYWSLLTLKLAYCAATGGAGIPAEKLNVDNVVSSYLLLPISEASGEKPMIAVAWTLTYEVLFYLVFALGIVFGGKFLMRLCLAWAATTLVLSAFFPEGLQLIASTVFNPHTLQFLAGCLAAWAISKQSTTIGVSLASIGLGLAVLATGLWNWDALKEQGLLAMSLTWGLCFTGLILGAVGLEQHEKLKCPAFLLLLGNASYSIYLLHTSIQSPAINIANKLASSYGLSYQLLLWGVAIGSVVAGLLCYLVLEKPLLQTSRFWLKSWTSRPATEVGAPVAAASK